MYYNPHKEDLYDPEERTEKKVGVFSENGKKLNYHPKSGNFYDPDELNGENEQYK